MPDTQDADTVRIVHGSDGQRHEIRDGRCHLCDKTWAAIKGHCDTCHEWLEFCGCPALTDGSLP